MYTKEFKLEIVKQTLDTQSRKSIKQIGAEYGVNPGTLGKWRAQYLEYGEEGFSPRGRLESQRDRVKELERELKETREENEILKKAAAFFAKENLK